MGREKQPVHGLVATRRKAVFNSNHSRETEGTQMTKAKKRQHRQGLDLIAIIKAIETGILIIGAIYKGVKLVIAEIRSQRTSPGSSTDSEGVDRWQLK
jgi:hypothetical protein